MASVNTSQQSSGQAPPERLRIAVIGSGISGLSAAWLCAKHHHVTLYEKEPRFGGHANTVRVETSTGPLAIDTGFIVYNSNNYPNLTALFDHLGVETAASDMSFSVSMNHGQFEYSGGRFSSLFAQPGNVMRPRFWSMLRDIVRFYRTAKTDRAMMERERLTLGDYLDKTGYGAAFQEDHLLPMAGAIWSGPPLALRAYPAAAFVDFFDNHELLNLGARPAWRTVAGGSQNYVAKIISELGDDTRRTAPVSKVAPEDGGVSVVEETGRTERFDRVIIATHPDQALKLLGSSSPDYARVLGAMAYTRNEAVLHSDARLMPKRRGAWAAWNFIGQRGDLERPVCVTYWMNKLQPLATRTNYFVTLNPPFEPDAGCVLQRQTYAHPAYAFAMLDAQRQLGSLQGRNNVWLCGAYFGSGFHEDGLRSGLEAGEAVSGYRRPWFDERMKPNQNGNGHH